MFTGKKALMVGLILFFQIILIGPHDRAAQWMLKQQSEG